MNALRYGCLILLSVVLPGWQGACAPPAGSDELARLPLLLEEERSALQRDGPTEVIASAYHANRLLEGDFRPRVQFMMVTRVGHYPYHLERLVELHEMATPELLQLLECQRLTPIRYSGTVTFETGLRNISPVDDRREHRATIGDLADYALRRIYAVDVGYRSYLSDGDRAKAISRWKRTAWEKGEYYRAFRMGTHHVERTIEAEIDLARSLMAEGKLEPAQAALNTARDRAKAHRLRGAEADIAAATGQLRACRSRLSRIRRAQAQLERAKASGDAESVRSARQGLGLIYLLADGDLAKADSYLSGTGQEYEGPVAGGVAFARDGRQIPSGCNDIVEALGRAANAAENKTARVRIATAGMNLCRAFLARNPQPLAATKARLLLKQLERTVATARPTTTTTRPGRW